MAMFTISEAAQRSGFSVELLEALIKKCPKPGEDHVLLAKDVGGTVYIDSADLESYRTYLRLPWPRPASGKRPRVPAAIERDVREESHHSCAICGDMNKGEVAHIDPVESTLNNSPDNLLLLCPNHHTEYDYGYRPSSNVSREVVLAHKKIKRESRRRMLRYEGNVAGTLRAVMQAIRSVRRTAEEATEDDVRETYLKELETLLDSLPALTEQAQEAASKDQDFAANEAAIVELAPQIFRESQRAAAEGATPQTAAEGILSVGRSLLTLDEVPCPHCSARGTVGLMGQLCAFCSGDQMVTEATARAYDRDEIDEVDCPHCDGRGTTGLMNKVCAFCGGDTVVSAEEAAEYDRDEIDEVDCPHCDGRGTTGLMNKPCAFCGGDTVVSGEKAAEYRDDDIDEVDCPHCDGRGTTGLMNKPCAFCGGDTVVSGEKAAEYRDDDIDEVDCPHCDGRGTTGLMNKPCAFCGGDTVVSGEKAAEYRDDDIDEVDCPHCNGQGETGLSGKTCAVCGGDTVISKALADEYREHYGSRYDV